MNKNLKLLEEVLDSGNELLLEQLRVTEGWTEDDIRKALSKRTLSLCKQLTEENRVYTWDELEDMLGDDGYDD